MVWIILPNKEIEGYSFIRILHKKCIKIFHIIIEITRVCDPRMSSRSGWSLKCQEARLSPTETVISTLTLLLCQPPNIKNISQGSQWLALVWMLPEDILIFLLLIIWQIVSFLMELFSGAGVVVYLSLQGSTFQIYLWAFSVWFKVCSLTQNTLEPLGLVII